MPRHLFQLLRRLLLGCASACLLGGLAVTPMASAQSIAVQPVTVASVCAPTSVSAASCLSLGLRPSDLGVPAAMPSLTPLGAPAAPFAAEPADTLRRLAPRAVAEPWVLTEPWSIAANDSLPSGMPLNTTILWGKHGVLRTLGVGPSTRRGERMMRRRMLGWHQRMGLLTFAAMTTQVVLGELIVANPAKHYESLQPIHKPLGYTTFGLYSATAVLSIGAPPGRRYSSGGFSSIRLHRWLAVVHFAGMMSMPWLGRSIADARGFDQLQDRQRRHQIVGRVTYGAFALALASTFLAY